MIELISRSTTAMFVYCGVLLYHWHAFNYVGPIKFFKLVTAKFLFGTRVYGAGSFVRWSLKFWPVIFFSGQ